jgi:putative addiction module component (TIGR02574 family)
MSIVEIKQLPMREKFLIMETLWEEMRAIADNANLPEDHRRILNTRREEVESGREKLLKWDDVKDRIGK